MDVTCGWHDLVHEFERDCLKIEVSTWCDGGEPYSVVEAKYYGRLVMSAEESRNSTVYNVYIGGHWVKLVREIYEEENIDNRLMFNS